MHHISFNQDSTCFLCGINDRFTVYNCDPLTERFKRTLPSGGDILFLQMLYKSNIFTVVLKEDPKTLMVWDDFQVKYIANLQFEKNITCVKILRDYILVATEDKIWLHDFTTLKLLKDYDIVDNLKGICSISNNVVIACLGVNKGSVFVHNYHTGYEINIQAHMHDITALALNAAGTILATASSKGTIIRLWDITTGNKIKELRRGLHNANITSLEFDSNSARLLACSNKGTAHIYSLLDTKANKKSSLNYISEYLPSYFSSEWSFISFSVPNNSICAFGSDKDTVYTITEDMKFLKYTYNINNSTSMCIEIVKLT